jgi:pimeloyl-ACP methyl ester carboxylesterase
MTTDLLRYAALVCALCLTVGIVVYIGASFVLMRPHTERRPFAIAAREALREATWAVLTQPLLPLFYFVGRRMGDGGGEVPVVLVHGYSQNRVDFLGVARALTRGGSGPLFGFNYAWFRRLAPSARDLARFVERTVRETGASEVDLVCHSQGGLVAMEYLSGVHGTPRVRRCVTIASPHAGIEYRGPIVGWCAADLRKGADFVRAHASRPLTVPTLSICSSHDNVVHPPSTSALAHRGGRDVVVPHRSHLAILFDRDVAREVVAFLAQATDSSSSGAQTQVGAGEPSVAA